MGLPRELQPLLAMVPIEFQSSVARDYARRRKSKTFAYLTWFFLGWHYLYLRRVGLQIALWLTGGGLLLWWLIDLFRVGPMVNRLNEDVARELILQYKAIGGHMAPPTPMIVMAPSAPMALVGPPASPPSLAGPTMLRPAAVGGGRPGLLALGGAVAVLIAGTAIYNARPTQAAVTTTGAHDYRTAREVNVRSGPTKHSAVVGVLATDEAVSGTVEPGRGRARWVKLSGGSYAGDYVSLSTLTPQ